MTDFLCCAPDLNFDTFDDRRLELMLSEARGFCAELSDGVDRDSHLGRWLTFLGNSGAGKTHLAKGVHEWVKKNFGYGPFYKRGDGSVTRTRVCRFVDCRDLADWARAREFAKVRELTDAFFLVLDDLGVEHDPNGFVASIYDRVLNARLGKWTIVTSNLLTSEIAKRLDVRIQSRLFRGKSKVIETDVQDYSARVCSTKI